MTERNRIVTERDRIVTECDHVVTERDHVVTEHDHVVPERDRVASGGIIRAVREEEDTCPSATSILAQNERNATAKSPCLGSGGGVVCSGNLGMERNLSGNSTKSQTSHLFEYAI